MEKSVNSQKNISDILSYINSLCHVKTKGGNQQVYFCFAKEVADVFGEDEIDICKLACSREYTIYNVSAINPSKEDFYQDGLVICDSGYSFDDLSSELTRIFGLDYDVKRDEMCSSDTNESVLEESVDNNSHNKSVLNEGGLSLGRPIPESDTRTWGIIDEVISSLRGNEILGYSVNKLMENGGILWERNDKSVSTFGTTYPPHIKDTEFVIVLNGYMLDNDEDEAIRNTVAHELCHYLVDKINLEQGVYVWVNSSTLVVNGFYKRDTGLWKSHGDRWKRVAEEVTKLVGLEKPISVYGSYEVHTGVAKAKDEKMKWSVTCKHCGNELKFLKKTEFVKNPNITKYDYLLSKYGNLYLRSKSDDVLNKDKRHYVWKCSKCNQCDGEWEVKQLR